MSKRAQAFLGIAVGAIWSVILLWVGSTLDIPPFSRILIEPYFLLAPGLILMVMIAVLVLQRLLSNTLIDGDPPVPGSGADINARVIRNTAEQIVLAVCLWPALSFLWLNDGLGLVMCLSVGFFLARIVYWVGYHYARPLRIFGFTATFLPTVFAVLWGLAVRLPNLIGSLSS